METGGNGGTGLHWVLLLLGALAAIVAVGSSAQAANYTINGDWVIGPSETVSNVSDNITVFGDVVVQGTLSLLNCTLNITYLPVPPPPQVARLGNAVVTGRLFITNTTVTFDVGLGGTITVPNGFRVSGSGSVSIRDGDFNATTEGDASRILASRSGTFSTVGPAASISAYNSQLHDMGWGPYPGLRLSGSSVYIDHVRFVNSPSLVPLGFAGVKVIEAGAGTRGSIGNSTFNFSVFPVDYDVVGIDSQAGPALWLNYLTFSGFARAIVCSNSVGAYLYNITVENHGVGVEFDNVSRGGLWGLHGGGSVNFDPDISWAPVGTLLAVRNSDNQTFTELRALAGLGANSSRPPVLFAFDRVENTSLDWVTADRPARLGEVTGSSWITITDINATGLVAGLNVTNSNRVSLAGGAMSGSAARLRLLSSSHVSLSDLGIANAVGTAVYANRSEYVDLLRVSLQSEWGLVADSCIIVSVRDSTVVATEGGVGIYGGAVASVVSSRVESGVFGVEAIGADQVLVDGTHVEHAGRGVDFYSSSNVSLLNSSLSPPPGQGGGEALRARNGGRTLVVAVNVSGNCSSVATFEVLASLVVDTLEASGCAKGASIQSISGVTVVNARFWGMWNGSGLALDSVTGAVVDGVGVYGTSDVGLSVSLGRDIEVHGVRVERAGAAGAILSGSANVSVYSSQFVGSGGTGLMLFGSSAPVVLWNVTLTGNREGLQVVSTASAVLDRVVSSNNTGDGVYVDRSSTNAVLSNLTVGYNGRNGLLVDAAGVSLIDGNISGNGWEGIAAGAGVRLSWAVQVAASFTDGSARLPGDLTVAPGATFRLERARLRPDSTPVSPRPGPWNAWSFGAGATAAFLSATIDPVNTSASYAVTFADGCSVSLQGVEFTGAGPADPRSRIEARGSAVTLRGVNITGFNQPLTVVGGTLLLVDVLLFDNTASLATSSTAVSFTNLTVRGSDGDGLVVTGGSLAGDRLNLADNAGAGLTASTLTSAAVSALLATGNAQGGASFDRTPLALDGALFSGNVLRALSVTNAGTVVLTNYTASLNAGPGLRVTGTTDLTLTRCLFDRAGGYGLDLENIAVFRLNDCTIAGSGGFGLKAHQVASFTGRNLTLDGNSVSHIVLEGQTDANLRYLRMVNSPGDAVLLRDVSTLFLEDSLCTGVVGGIHGLGDAYAYLLNATFASDPIVQDNAQVDIAWKVLVHVVLADGAPVGAALVGAFGPAGAALASATTNGSGWTPLMEVLEARVYGSRAAEVYTPQLFNATIASGAGGETVQAVEANAVVTVTIDNEAPVTVVSLDGPVGAGGWYTGPVTVALHATDRAGGALTLWWRSSTDLAGWSSLAADTGTVEAAALVDAEGPTLFEFYAVDGAGNAEPPRSVTIMIDRTRPVVEFGPLPAMTERPFIDLSWNATDTGGSGNITYLLQVSTYGGPWTDLLAGAPETSYHFEGADGAYQFRLVATDAAGHLSDPASAAVRIALNGTLVIRPVDEQGADVGGATVWVGPLNATFLTTGPLDLSLPPGDYRISISAAGYAPVEFTVHVDAGRTADPGPVVLERRTISAAAEDTGGVMLVIVALALLLTLLWAFVRSRMGPPRLGSL